jgi:hypothetical protein
MILSHEHRFIFIKTQKTAGTSMELALSRCSGPRDVITPVARTDERLRRRTGGRGPQGHLDPLAAYAPADWAALLFAGRRRLRYYNHMPAARVRELAGEEVWNSYFKFCFERNPWDKVISAYAFRTRRIRRRSLGQFILDGEFRDFVDFDLYSLGGEVAVDFVGRYENLQEDWARICRHLRLPGAVDLASAKSGFRTDRRPYQEQLGPAEAQAIASAFHREIARFGYRFTAAAPAAA